MDVEVDPDPDSESPVPPSGSPDPALGTDLAVMVSAARRGDQAAWNALIHRYTPLVLSITFRYRLSRSDAEDVSQTVWLRLLENFRSLRDPRALPGWISTTTNREALRVSALARRVAPMDPFVLIGVHPQRAGEAGVDHELLGVERDRAVRDGLAELTAEHRKLLILLHTEPKVSYQEISSALGVPRGSIGPTRARCLKKLRSTTAVQTLLRSDGDLEASQAA